MFKHLLLDCHFKSLCSKVKPPPPTPQKRRREKKKITSATITNDTLGQRELIIDFFLPNWVCAVMRIHPQIPILSLEKPWHCSVWYLFCTWKMMTCLLLFDDILDAKQNILFPVDCEGGVFALRLFTCHSFYCQLPSFFLLFGNALQTAKSVRSFIYAWTVSSSADDRELFLLVWL